MKEPTEWKIKALIDHAACNSVQIGGAWVAARPIGLCSIKRRFQLAWRVFTGECDAVRWEKGQ